jgi:hypothetical protein
VIGLAARRWGFGALNLAATCPQLVGDRPTVQPHTFMNSGINGEQVMRRCHMCGRETSQRLIVEPRLIPVCSQPSCRTDAAALPECYCATRLENGRVCGAAVVALLQADELPLCGSHARQHLRAAPTHKQRIA